jgi:hypothetical protein
VSETVSEPVPETAREEISPDLPQFNDIQDFLSYLPELSGKSQEGA